MSRSRNQHKKTYNFPLWEARKWARKSVRSQSRRIIDELMQAEDVEEVPTKIYEKDRSGKGNIWNWD